MKSKLDLGRKGIARIKGSSLTPMWGHGSDLYWTGCDLAPHRETFANFFVMKTPQGLTQIAIRRPSAGTWKVLPLEGTITSVKSANGLSKPSVKAKARKGRLHYPVKRISGQVVRFTQEGRELGRAKGSLRVKATGPITALVEQDGRLRNCMTIQP